MAFADDLILPIRGKSARAAENYSNGELSKITAWSKGNEIRFNEQKSKVMLVSRRKPKAIKVYLNNKPLEQVTRIKYLGIIIDRKFRFKEHITCAAERCTKLIHNLFKSPKKSWGIKHEAIKTIYKGAILTLLLYGAPVWIDAMKYEHNRQKYIRVQRLINIGMAKAYCTTSNEALRILTGVTPIIIKTEAVKLYNITKRNGSQTHIFNNDVELKDWPHPADAVKITEVKDYKETVVQAYNDGSKYEQGVGSGAAVFIGKEIVTQIKLKLDSRCSNNQAEQLAITKALGAIRSIHSAEINPCTATIYTNSRITLDLLQNTNNHAYLIKDIRKRVAILESSEWKIEISWVKAHVGICGNEIADRLAKEAARSKDTNIAYNRIPKSTLCFEVEAKQQWQNEWEKFVKVAITKQYFPTIQDRLNMKISITPTIAAMVTGHGKTRVYLHRFKLLEHATCICKHGDQTTDHLLYHCTLLQIQREVLKQNILKSRNLPASKHDLITKHRDSFITFIKSTDFGLL